MKSIYIAGPMSGLPEFNFPAFFEAQSMLEAQGWKVWNPAAKDMEVSLDPNAYKVGDEKLAMQNGFNFREAYGWDCDKVINGDGIYMLRGWEASPGARGEHAVAVAMKSKHPEYVIMYQDA
jgi:hypothetical protein